MRVAFVLTDLSFRGTQGNAWCLAHYNETLLGNESLIVCTVPLTHRDEDTTDESVAFFTDRFQVFYSSEADLNACLVEKGVDAAYVVVGADTSYVPTSVPTVTHGVFTNGNPGGTVKTAVSPQVAQGKVVVLPNIIEVDFREKGDLRAELGIPPHARVFGRHGGMGMYNVPMVREAILDYARNCPHDYFLYLNTEKFGEELPNVIFLPGKRDVKYKTRFINTCDAMLHCGGYGETFGMSCGEFAVLGKPVFTMPFGVPGHLYFLSDTAILYSSDHELWYKLQTFKKGTLIGPTRYRHCLPVYIMPLFEQLLEVAVETFKLQ